MTSTPPGGDLADLIDTALRGGAVSGYTISFTPPGVAVGDPLYELMMAADFDPARLGL
ncbi:MAG: hypothetical protein GX430_00430 [Treponema sp.]|nr:hypothetical protein [Treponema sp.]